MFHGRTQPPTNKAIIAFKLTIKTAIQRITVPVVMALVITNVFLSGQPAIAFQFDQNVPGDLQKQFTADVDFVKSVELANPTPLHLEIYQGPGGPSYFDFFNTRVEKVGLNSCGDPNAVACVIPWYGSSAIWLSPNYTKFAHPQIARLMIIFHETRHTESRNSNWPHAVCPNPFLDSQGREIKSIWTGAALAGKDGCDSTHLGAYASTVIMMKNIERSCKTCTEKVKMDAGIYGSDQFNRVVNSVAKGKIKKDLGLFL